VTNVEQKEHVLRMFTKMTMMTDKQELRVQVDRLKRRVDELEKAREEAIKSLPPETEAVEILKRTR
jgi:tetrahydromethanopterin S-methyltransferase subunit B